MYVFKFLHTSIQKIQMPHCNFHIGKCFIMYVKSITSFLIYHLKVICTAVQWMSESFNKIYKVAEDNNLHMLLKVIPLSKSHKKNKNTNNNIKYEFSLNTILHH